MRSETLLIRLLQRLVDWDSAAFAGGNGASDGLESVQLEDERVGSGGNLDASGGNFASGAPVDKDFSAGRIAGHLGPSDVTGGALVEFGTELRLDVFLYLHAADVRIVALQAEDKIVLAGSQRKRDRRLAGLLGAVDKDVGTGRVTGDVQTLS